MPGRLPLGAWMREGLRAGFLLKPRVGAAEPTPAQLLLVLVVFSALELVLGRFEVAGDAVFDLRGWLVPWWSVGALLLVAWWALTPRVAGEPRGSLAAWFLLWTTAVVPANSVSQLLGIAQAHGALPDLLQQSAWAAWLVYLGLWAWTLAVVVRVTQAFAPSRRRLAAVLAVFVVVFLASASLFPESAWKEDAEQLAQQQPAQLELSQDTFEDQQALLLKVLGGLEPQRPGVVDVYGLVFSPYASEDVFLRESTMVADVLAERFDAAGRVVQLANHASTPDSLPWATARNLERAVAAIAQRMDLDNDVLVVYLTSHGANDFKLAAANPPLDVEPISPGELRQALDNAGVKNRVILISACYSGGWVGPLADDHTLVMTAADATHTSYGCGKLSDLTFFGRAVFDEQLRKLTHSFEKAYAAAVPVIRKRESDAGKDDGFSNPQISIGEKIRPLLRQLEQRLEAAAQK